MKVAVVGSRNLSPNIEPHLPEGTTAIVTGGAKGVDQAAMDLAERLGLKLIVFKPDYKRYGRGATIVRNKWPCIITGGCRMLLIFLYFLQSYHDQPLS